MGPPDYPQNTPKKGVFLANVHGVYWGFPYFYENRFQKGSKKRVVLTRFRAPFLRAKSRFLPRREWPKKWSKRVSLFGPFLGPFYLASWEKRWPKTVSFCAFVDTEKGPFWGLFGTVFRRSGPNRLIWSHFGGDRGQIPGFRGIAGEIGPFGGSNWGFRTCATTLTARVLGLREHKMMPNSRYVEFTEPTRRVFILHSLPIKRLFWNRRIYRHRCSHYSDRICGKPGGESADLCTICRCDSGHSSGRDSISGGWSAHQLLADGAEGRGKRGFCHLRYMPVRHITPL